MSRKGSNKKFLALLIVISFAISIMVFSGLINLVSASTTDVLNVSVYGAVNSVTITDKTNPSYSTTLTSFPSTFSYADGDSLTFTGAPTAGASFTQWDFSSGSSYYVKTGNPYTQTVIAGSSLEAVFSLLTVESLPVSVVGNCKSITITDSTNPSYTLKLTSFPSTFTYLDGDLLTFAATPSAGYSFTDYNVTLTGGYISINTTNPYTRAYYNGESVQAVFSATPASSSGLILTVTHAKAGPALLGQMLEIGLVIAVVVILVAVMVEVKRRTVKIRSG
jgi:hypothetical protein